MKSPLHLHLSTISLILIRNSLPIQRQWTYMDPYRRKFKIGLYHGDDSGHVLMHVNGDPIIIDFSIKDEKEYSFYVGPQLFNLHFKKSSEEFIYNLERDDETPTRLNMARKKSEQEDVWYMCAGAGMVTIILLSVLLF